MTTPFDVFGPGALYCQRTDIANAQVLNVGYSQEFSVEYSGNIKELFGQNQFALDAARGTIKVTSKVKTAVVSGLAWNTLFFGNSFTTGTINSVTNEGPTAIPMTPFQITVANGAQFDQDLGVLNSVTSIPFTKVASGPTVGQYSVNSTTGVYTFASADNVSGISVVISYTYKQTAVGQTLTIANQLLGSAPIFQLDYYTVRYGKAMMARFYQCQAAKLTMAAKLEDFLMPEFEVHMFANSAGNLGKLYFPEIS
jgi:hypothetical protein